MNIIARMAQDFKIDHSYLSKIVYRSAFYYKDYYINKRDGKTRRISQASPQLKAMQYWIVENILAKIPVSKGAYAYKKGDSIKRHADIHRLSKHIFHTDIKDFFFNIHFEMLRCALSNHSHIFDEIGIDSSEAFSDIKKICFRNDELCIGTVSSPIISNIVMYNFDEKMIDYCNRNGWIYSRYADDIYISSNYYIPKEVKNFVSAELSDNGFKINTKKTSFISNKYCRKVTGVVLSNDGRVSVGTKQRNAIRKMVYDKIIHKKGSPETILGYIAFLKDIEPQTYNNIIIKYSKYCAGDVIDEISK
ncbi:MAG: retron St85 family RNA-directed DNA polymerase [Clostridia bacterium]|nr:retron St85 family RNA-directed DNA polymerase [Clostridia bacterium]